MHRISRLRPPHQYISNLENVGFGEFAVVAGKAEALGEHESNVVREGWRRSRLK